jgi:hypothetical protein
VQPLLAVSRSRALRKFASDLAPGPLDVTNAGRARGQRPDQPAGELRVARRALAAGLGVGVDRPEGPRPPAAATLGLPEQQPGLVHALKMQADAVGMKLQELGELVGARRPSQLAEQLEQARARGLRQRIAGSHRHVHGGTLTHGPCGNQRAKATGATSSGCW